MQNTQLWQQTNNPHNSTKLLSHGSAFSHSKTSLFASSRSSSRWSPCLSQESACPRDTSGSRDSLKKPLRQPRIKDGGVSGEEREAEAAGEVSGYLEDQPAAPSLSPPSSKLHLRHCTAELSGSPPPADRRMGRHAGPNLFCLPGHGS